MDCHEEGYARNYWSVTVITETNVIFKTSQMYEVIDFDKSFDNLYKDLVIIKSSLADILTQWLISSRRISAPIRSRSSILPHVC